MTHLHFRVKQTRQKFYPGKTFSHKVFSDHTKEFPLNCAGCGEKQLIQRHRESTKKKKKNKSCFVFFTLIRGNFVQITQSKNKPTLFFCFLTLIYTLSSCISRITEQKKGSSFTKTLLIIKY